MASLTLKPESGSRPARLACREQPAVAGLPPAVETDPAAGGEAEEGRDWLRITRGIAAGDADCFQIYYGAFFSLIYGEARRLLGRDEDTCLDVVQESLLKALRRMRPIGSSGQLQQWTRMVVRTTALDWLRRRVRRRETPVDRIDAASLPMDGGREGSDPGDLARMAWIEEQLQEMDPALRQMLELRYRLGWTLQRIGNCFGIRSGAVDGRIRRGLEHLRRGAASSFPDNQD